jgi:adhesin/invasin
VKPGPVSHANSFVTVSSGSIQSGSTTTVTLQAEDAHGNLETSGGWVVAFELGSVGGGRGTFTPAKDNHNGTYTATFTGTIAGSNTITATISGSKITSVAPAITVTPGAVSLAKSVVTLSAGSVKSGSTIAVTLQTKDAAGNKETTGGLTVAFALGSLTGGQGTLTSFTDNGNGTYTAIFTGTLVGSNTIKATIDGEDLTSISPSIAIV